MARKEAWNPPFLKRMGGLGGTPVKRLRKRQYDHNQGSRERGVPLQGHPATAVRYNVIGKNFFKFKVMLNGCANIAIGGLNDSSPLRGM